MIRRAAAVFAATLALGAVRPAVADDAGAASVARPTDASTPRAADAGSASTSGEPRPTGSDSAAAADPHAGAGGAGGAGSGGDAAFMKPLEDAVVADPSLPFGTITAVIRDANDRPRAGVTVTLGIIFNSVAKGESRREVTAQTDSEGRVRWDKLEGGSAMSYRISVRQGPGLFAAAPFNLETGKGMRAVLHTYPVSTDITSALVVMQGVVYLELKDDRVQVQQAFNVFNFGKTAWVPTDFVIPLPQGFTALTAVQSMSDQTVEEVKGQGAALKGTFGPGQHSVEYRWQAPYSGESVLDLTLGMPQNLAAARVMVVASQEMKVSVDDFPAVRAGRDGQGNSIVETEREMRREDPPLRTLHIVLRDIPGPGPGRYVATGLAAAGVALGLAYALRSRRGGGSDKEERGKERARLLAELEDLERARRDGDIGPRTYENARRELIDALARTLAAEPETAA
ncbi:MAG: hypothetical protein U0235_02390 [Polyangiaceae bacterium]